MVKNIVFDIGKVLIGFDWDAYIKSLFDEETAAKVSRAMFRSGHWPELDRAVLSEQEILELFYSVSPDVKEEIDEAFDRIGECVAKRDWPCDLIKTLKDRGYGVYFLSNMSRHVIDSNPEAFAFTELMDGGVFSCNVHLIKPDLAIYRKFLDTYGLKAKECLFVDDHEENVAAARRLGMKTVRFDSHEQMEKDLMQALSKDGTHDNITVLCYGDSNTYGYDPETGGRYPYEKIWTTLLGEMLGDKYEVINQGLNGRTTSYDRPDAAWKNGSSSFLACLGTHKPVDVLVIMLGTNDCNEYLHLSSEQIADGMDNLVKLAEEYSPEIQGYVPRIIVVAPTAIGDDFDNSPFAPNLTEDSVKKSHEIGPLYEKLAAEHDCGFVNAVDVAEVSPLDSEHLTEKGHRQIAEMLCHEITKDY